MSLFSRPNWFLLLFSFLVGWTTAQGQAVLVGDAELQAADVVVPERSVAPTGAARINTLVLPFFDDFSYDADRPDTSRWLIHPQDVRQPSISIQKGHNAPSLGVATFDGANVNGFKYTHLFSTGPNDTLTSQPIDLSALSPADSVVLSFFVERGGAGEAPEATDSMVVLFDTTGNFDFVQVWALKGTGSLENDFRLFHVILDSNFYFHSAFHFKFVTYGSLNGELDQFHLDYVQLDAGRSVLDSALNDVSPLRITGSPFGNYTALPRKQVRRSNVMQPLEISVSNAGQPNSSANCSLEISDPEGGNVFTGTTMVSASIPSLASFRVDTAIAGPFSEQGSIWGPYGVVEVAASKTAPGDLHPENDILRQTYRVDSILALDDGVSDIGFGLTAARSFCQEYNIDQPDTLVAVWIRFTSAMHYNQPVNLSTDLFGKGFRLVVWDTLAVDSSLLETSGGMNVDYGSGPNEFVRYQLIREVEVPAQFWIGIRQTDGMPIAMGLDRSSSTVQRIYFEDATGRFVMSSQRGALMMRPEFKVPNIGTGVPSPQATIALPMTVSPNPVAAGGELTYQLPDAQNLLGANGRIVDMQGRVITTWQVPRPARENQIKLDNGLAPGLYLLDLTAQDRHGRMRRSCHKIKVSQ